jgi:hypothetical protein
MPSVYHGVRRCKIDYLQGLFAYPQDSFHLPAVALPVIRGGAKRQLPEGSGEMRRIVEADAAGNLRNRNQGVPQHLAGQPDSKVDQVRSGRHARLFPESFVQSRSVHIQVPGQFRHCYFPAVIGVEKQHCLSDEFGIVVQQDLTVRVRDQKNSLEKKQDFDQVGSAPARPKAIFLFLQFIFQADKQLLQRPEHRYSDCKVPMIAGPSRKKRAQAGAVIAFRCRHPASVPSDVAKIQGAVDGRRGEIYRKCIYAGILLKQDILRLIQAKDCRGIEKQPVSAYIQNTGAALDQNDPESVADPPSGEVLPGVAGQQNAHAGIPGFAHCLKIDFITPYSINPFFYYSILIHPCQYL